MRLEFQLTWARIPIFEGIVGMVVPALGETEECGWISGIKANLVYILSSRPSRAKERLSQEGLRRKPNHKEIMGLFWGYCYCEETL